MVEPAEFGGFGRVEGEPYGGLLGQRFQSRCPPAITLETIIIAVCGPNDYHDNASINHDGWFFSDFYLFRHLFRGTAKEQHWMTCVDPATLIKKYKEYAHGDPRTSERRVVLDASMKDDVKDVLVFDGLDLLERFLAYVTNACKQVKNTSRPILVLMFGHGRSDDYQITLGGNGPFDKCNRLDISKFKEALIRHNPDANVALLTTSCFGGGWTQSALLNISAMAGTSEKNELLSWPISASVGRVCGSRYATGVANALIRNEIEGIELARDERSEIDGSPTYAALQYSIHEILAKEIDIRESAGISFSAKDDMWGMEWRARTGFPMTGYKEKWEALRQVVSVGSSGASHSASVRVSDVLTLSSYEAEFRLKRLATEYFESHPGPDDAAKNHASHYRARFLLQGKKLTDEELERLAGALRYRLKGIMDQATRYKDFLGLDFPDCRDFDSTLYSQHVREDKEKHERYGKIMKFVLDRDLFDGPEEHEGMPYIKGIEYIRAALLESGWSYQKIKNAAEALVMLRGTFF